MLARTRSLIALAALTLAAFSVVALTGCTSGADELQTINNSDSLFHVKAPSSWQQRVDDNFMGLYAAEKLPSSESLDSLSIVILSGRSVSSTPPAELLSEFAHDRAVSRQWKNPKLSGTSKTAVGGRPASMIAVSGTGANGAFAGAYYLIRTAGSDVLVMAVAPAKEWEASKPAVTELTKNWFWHEPAGDETSSTP